MRSKLEVPTYRPYYSLLCLVAVQKRRVGHQTHGRSYVIPDARHRLLGQFLHEILSPILSNSHLLGTFVMLRILIRCGYLPKVSMSWVPLFIECSCSMM